MILTEGKHTKNDIDDTMIIMIEEIQLQKIHNKRLALAAKTLLLLLSVVVNVASISIIKRIVVVVD